jgi:hypothetical protein
MMDCRHTSLLVSTRSAHFLRSVVLTTFLITGVTLSLLAQRRCGTMNYLQQQLDADPQMQRAMHRIDRSAQHRVKAVSGVITIPVVVHVVYHTPVENLSEAQIHSQLRVLNQDFRRRNRDAAQTHARWHAVASDTEIQFELAKRDPNGNPTTGITRTYTSKSVFYAGDNAVKYGAQGGVEAWDTRHYLNIWVCHLGMGVLGYAQFPGGPRETDGVVISYNHFGTMGTVSAPFDLGRTTTHEVGHWLNLRHIWGDGGCETDDHVADTPPADRPHHGCVSFAESCGSPNMVQNFMDYTDDACMNLFTRGQAQRMRTLFVAGGFRHELLTSPALEAPTPPIAYLEAPGDVEVYQVGNNFARLRWSVIPGAEQYQVRLREVGGPWIERTFVRPYVNPSQLKQCVEYECQVAALKGSEVGPFSTPILFATAGCSRPLVLREAPRELGAEPENSGVARLTWRPVPGAVRYKVQFKSLGSKHIVERRPYEASAKVGGLQASRQYLFRVRAEFNEASPTAYSDIYQFAYGTLAQTGYRIRAVSNHQAQFTRYDSGQRRMYLKLPLDEATRFEPRIRDQLGQPVKTYPSGLVQPEQTMSLEVPLLSPGDYFLELIDEDGFVYQEPFRVP